MSETVSTEAAAPVETTQDAPETQVQQPVEQQAEGDQGAQVEAQQEESQAEQKPEKQSRSARHVAQLTARNSALATELEDLRRRAEASEALLKESKGDTGEQPAKRPAESSSDYEARVQQAARRLHQDQESERQRLSLVEAGRKSYADWDQKAAMLHSFGATTNPAFMEALVGLSSDEGTKLVAHLADDPDALVGLLARGPVAMASAMGKMAADISKPVVEAPKPAISRAPRPITPITTPAVAPEQTVYDETLSMADYVKLRQKTAPRHLGGTGRGPT